MTLQQINELKIIENNLYEISCEVGEVEGRRLWEIWNNLYNYIYNREWLGGYEDEQV